MAESLHDYRRRQAKVRKHWRKLWKLPAEAGPGDDATLMDYDYSQWCKAHGLLE